MKNEQGKLPIPLLSRLAIAALMLGTAGTVYAVAQPPAGAPMTAEEKQKHVEEIIAEYISPVRKPTAPANSVPRVFGKPDFSGFWKEDQGVLYSDPTPGAAGGAHPGWDDTIHPPPYNAEWQKKYDDHKRDAITKGPSRLYDCDPPGMPRLIVQPFPVQLAQLKDELLMLFEFKSQIRHLYMDGRPHPSEDDYDASYNGHSIAHWEDETLVVDTTMIGGFPGQYVQASGLAMSSQLHVIERVRFLNPDRIEWEVTMIDPVALTRPWVSKRSFSRYMKGKKYDVPEYECLARENLEMLGYDGEMPPKKSDIIIKKKPAAPATKK